MVAAPEQRASTTALELIQGSLSSGRIARRSPLLGGLHRLMDGTLLGLILAVAVLAGLTLHWQHRWTLAFRLLESTRLQAHRLTESTAVMEQHLLQRSQQPKSLVPTQVANLVHLDRPALGSPEPVAPSPMASLQLLKSQPIRAGY
nr:hypothetical protein [Synechococcus sp. KORDI-52]